LNTKQIRAQAVRVSIEADHNLINDIAKVRFSETV
jgi:hypothetical protein